MSFEGRLKNLGAEDLFEIEAGKAEEERRRRLDEEIRERIEEVKREVKEMEVIAKEKLQPTLELVNDVLLGGAGEIDLSSNEYNICQRYNYNLETKVTLGMWWNTRSGQRDDTKISKGKSLLLCMSPNRMVTIEGGAEDSPVVELNLEDEKWKQQLEDGIYSILTTLGACSWKIESNIIEGSL